MSKGVFVTNEQVRLTGSPNVARFLAQCLYWSTKCDLVIQRQGWFYKSREEWQAETWLSRYQQEKARQQLRDMGLLKERHERRNTGIRLWFWLDQALLNVMLNNLAEQSEITVAENNPVELYDSSLTKQPDNGLTGQLDNCKEIEGSNSIEEYKTIVLKTPLNEFVNGVNGTMVLINFNNEALNNSDYDCINNDVDTVEVYEEVGSDKEEACASSLSARECNVSIENESFDDAIPFFDEEGIANKLELISNQAVISQYCEDPETYKACHPFIYQFLKTRLFTGFEWSETALKLFRANGLRCGILQDALRVFINNWGHSILSWYQANTPIPVQPLNKDDLELAVFISQRALL